MTGERFHGGGGRAGGGASRSLPGGPFFDATSGPEGRRVPAAAGSVAIQTRGRAGAAPLRTPSRQPSCTLQQDHQKLFVGWHTS